MNEKEQGPVEPGSCFIQSLGKLGDHVVICGFQASSSEDTFDPPPWAMPWFPPPLPSSRTIADLKAAAASREVSWERATTRYALSWPNEPTTAAVEGLPTSFKGELLGGVHIALSGVVHNHFDPGIGLCLIPNPYRIIFHEPLACVLQRLPGVLELAEHSLYLLLQLHRVY